jgi:hypothetical protein
LYPIEARPVPRPPQPVVPRGQPRRSFLLVAVVNTGAMWGFAADAAGAADTVSPYLVAAAVDRGADAPAPADGAELRQPEGAPALEMARLPAGFWPGRVSARGGGAGSCGVAPRRLVRRGTAFGGRPDACLDRPWCVLGSHG